MVAWQFFSRLLKDRAGNFGMMTAILLPVLLGAGGIAIDVTNMMMSKTQLQDAADAASLAASTALANGQAANDDEAELLARQFFIGQVANYFGDDTAEKIGNSTAFNVTTTINGTSKKYDVGVNSTYGMALTPLMGVLGYETMNIAVNSASTSGTTNTKSALSMVLVLDESGSMKDKTNTVKSKTCKKYKWDGKCDEWNTVYVTKMEALKTAAAALFTALEKADPTGDLTRTGAISYNHNVMGQTSPTMSWGTSDARKHVSQMPEPPAGGTDAREAVKLADAAVKKFLDNSDRESKEHLVKNNSVVDRYMVLMTDGEMTGYSNQWKEYIHNEVRENCTKAKQDGITIFAVAFMAPKNGKELLGDCASSSENYFEPETMEQLVNTFSSIAQHATKARTLLTN